MIYTFYSYKGGVGRSMALVNIAELMYQAGRKVIMVDWDLEAPGLERHYPKQLDRVLNRTGVIDLLINYKERASRYRLESSEPIFKEDELESCLVNLYPDDSGPGKLSLLPAGLRSGEQFINYATRVKTFDWQGFYHDWEGEIYFEWLRTQLNLRADAVLIDARTGVTEMGGVCTYQLADIVIMLCAANQQNMEGTQRMLESFSNPQLPTLRAGRELHVVIVPARVERIAETQTLNKFRQDFASRFLPYMPEAFKRSSTSLVDLEIPYVPRYAFEEIIAVNQMHSNERSIELETAYAQLFHTLMQGSVVVSEHNPNARLYNDFDLTVDKNENQQYRISARSSFGHVIEIVSLPDWLTTDTYQLKLKSLDIGEEQICEYGILLFDFLFNGRIRSIYEVSLIAAEREEAGLRIRFSTDDPFITSLPWEYLYDKNRNQFLSLSLRTLFIRYLDLTRLAKPVVLKPPIRVLGMVVNPIDLSTPLDTATEKHQFEIATEQLRLNGLLEITWLEGQTADDLQQAMRSGSWHIFHFIGIGGFDELNDMGYICLADDKGYAVKFTASQLSRLLTDHRSLRLAVLNSSNTARVGQTKIYSSCAASLVHAGLAAAIGLQYVITDTAATKLTRNFYKALTDGFPVDAALNEARKAISNADKITWGAPVLYMRTPDGILFDLMERLNS